MRTYHVKITGLTPLLMHWDNIEWADEMSAWKDDPVNKKSSKAGDDRTPAHRWLGCVYHDGKHVVIPRENIMASLMQGGTMVPVSGKKTFKAQTQSGLRIFEDSWPLLINDRPILYEDLAALKDESSFAKHAETAKELGFSLFVKRARVGTSKHIRVRPQFVNWSSEGEIVVLDEQITDDALKHFFFYAGNYKGLGDWRPGSPTPGGYGMFAGLIKRVR